jgi:hypothetical protein
MADNDKSTEVVEEQQGTQGDDNNASLDNYGGFKPDDAVVKIAMEGHWKPKDQFDDPSKWVPPDQFVRNQYAINEAVKNGRKRLESQVEQLTKQVRLLTEQNTVKSQQELESTKERLKQARKQAAEAGDTDAVENISEQLEELAAARKGNAEPSLDPAVSEWMSQNQWYKPNGNGADDEVEDLIELVEELNSTEDFQRLSPRFRLAKIDKEIADYVQMRRPDLIGKYDFTGIRATKSAAPKDDGKKADSNRQAISDVEGNASRSAPSGNKLTKSMLNEQERKIMQSTLFNNPNLTEEKWLADYNKSLGNE